MTRLFALPIALALSIGALPALTGEEIMEGCEGNPTPFPDPGSEGESPYIYGIHDHDTGSEAFTDRLLNQGVTGWVTATVAIGANPSDTGGGDFRSFSDDGHSVIVRLNYGYCPEGTIPPASQYADFAQRAANYVANTQGADIFIIGNETNLAAEWPSGGGGHLSYVSPQSYADVFRQTYNAIKAVRPDAKVITQALAPFAGPYGAGSTCGKTHDAQPLNWVTYLNQMLTAIAATGPLDGIGLHINSRGYGIDDIHSTQRVNAGGQNLYFSFYVYKDWVDYGIPQSLWNLPLYATEANGIYYWKGGHPENPGATYEAGWAQEIYAEINRYNQLAAASVPRKPQYRAVNLYRWCEWCDDWNIKGSPQEGQILADVEDAARQGYTWSGGGTVDPPDPTVELVSGGAATLTSDNFSGDFGGDKAVDGIISQSSKWTSSGGSPESWLAVDLGSNVSLDRTTVQHAGAAGEFTDFNLSRYRIETGPSLSGPWTTRDTVSNGSQANTTTSNLGGISARYVRLYVEDAGIDDYARVPEFQVYGSR